MPKLIVENDDGQREEYTTFFGVLTRDIGVGGEFKKVIAVDEDCRVLVAGAMFKKAAIWAEEGWNEFAKLALNTGNLLDTPDRDALNARIKWSSC